LVQTKGRRDVEGESVGDLTQWQDRRAQTLESMQLVIGQLPNQSTLESLDVEVIETVRIADVVPPCKRSIDCLRRIL
jgi:hypothetical protein